MKPLSVKIACLLGIQNEVQAVWSDKKKRLGETWSGVSFKSSLGSQLFLSLNWEKIESSMSALSGHKGVCANDMSRWDSTWIVWQSRPVLSVIHFETDFRIGAKRRECSCQLFTSVPKVFFVTKRADLPCQGSTKCPFLKLGRTY